MNNPAIQNDVVNGVTKQQIDLKLTHPQPHSTIVYLGVEM